jgi:hypothetical protein
MALMVVLAGCAGYETPLVNTPRLDSTLFVPNPTQFVRREAALTPLTQADLVDAAGNCAGTPAAPEGSLPSPARNVALQMTECEVVQSLGQPAEVQIGANARGDRSVTLTYAAGNRPVYRFTNGRLTLVERTAEPQPEPTKKKPAKRQASRPS